MTGPNDISKPSRNAGKRRILSLRSIASLAAAGLVAVTVLVIAHFNEQDMRQTLEYEAKNQLVVEARNLSLLSIDALLSDFPELTLMPLVQDIMNSRQEIKEVIIVNHKGAIVGSPDPRAVGTSYRPLPDLKPARMDHNLRPDELLSENDFLILMDTPVQRSGDSPLGRVLIALDKQFIADKIRESRNQLIRIAAILMVVATIIAGGLMSQLFRPLSTLRAGLERIGSGDLDSPMKIRSLTELGVLAGTVDDMAAQLKRSRALAQDRKREIIATQKEIIVTLGQVVESRSSETANHTLRVGDMSHQLALLAGMSEREAELLRMASPMHDIGKIGIPDSILNKPGKLTDEEYAIIKTHAEIGSRILAKSERIILKTAAIIAGQHHEHWDGNGYPNGLKGEEIHIYGRIVGLVDVFDAIFCDRIYRKAMELPQALEVISANRGKHFDPRLVDLFLANLKQFTAISDRYQDDREGNSDGFSIDAIIAEVMEENLLV